jgi:hypothetical protein
MLFCGVLIEWQSIVRKWREWPGCPPILLADHCGVAGFINFHEQLVEAFALYSDMLELGPSVRQAVLDKHDLFNSHGVGKDLRESSGDAGWRVLVKTYNTEVMDGNQIRRQEKQETDGSLGWLGRAGTCHMSRIPKYIV